MITIQRDWVDLEEVPVNIWDIQMEMREFYRLIDYDEEDGIGDILDRIIEARGHLSSAKTLTVNLLEPEHNKYIEKERQFYDEMVSNMGRRDKRLDAIEDGIMTDIKSYSQIGREYSLKIRTYIKELNEDAKHFVYFPIKNSYIKFIRFDEVDEQTKNKIKKDAKLYLYFLFLQLFHSSESLGALTKEATSGIKQVDPATLRKLLEMRKNSTPPSSPKEPETEEDVGDDSGIEGYPEPDEEGEEDLFK